MGVRPDHSCKFFYHVVEHDVTLEFYCYVNKPDRIATLAAEHYMNQTDDETIKDFPLTFAIHDQGMAFLGQFSIDIGGWTPDFIVVPVP